MQIKPELSWLEFNHRVLEEARNRSNPLLERLKFLTIVSSNLDEFFMVRVAALWLHDPQSTMLINKITARVRQMVHDQYNCYQRMLTPALRRQGIDITTAAKLTTAQRSYLHNYITQVVLPQLKPVFLSEQQPFPLILNGHFNFIVLLTQPGTKQHQFATIALPVKLNRCIEVPGNEDNRTFISLEQLIKLYLPTLFREFRVICAGCYRVTRNAELNINVMPNQSMMQTLKTALCQQVYGKIIRLEVETRMNPRLKHYLMTQLGLNDQQVYTIPGPLDLTYLTRLVCLPGYKHLRYPPLHPQPVPQFFNQDPFTAITAGDILVHHPYESFNAVLGLLQQAAHDPQVHSIKQSLYRVSSHSKVIAALTEAAAHGKAVTVLVEMRARFDETNNIQWVKRLIQAGCQVIYGMPYLKTHCKMLLIHRQEKNGDKQYLHLSTGNYNEVTAKTYVDLGLFTANPTLCADAEKLFTILAGKQPLTTLTAMLIAPINLRTELTALIRREMHYAAAGQPARIILKANALVDKQLINELDAAARIGVQVDLIIRGACCLSTDIPGTHDNLQVRSIVGRFLEHSRIFAFANGGSPQVYLSSADLMPRNLDRRVELAFPVYDLKLRSRICAILEAYLQDNVKARVLKADGSYRRVNRRGKRPFNCQAAFVNK